jgi:hypothetical protein
MDATEKPAEVVQEDVPCRRCAYNLRTLAVDGRCPECGTEVRPSLRGRELVNADPDWLSWICRGAVLFGTGLILLTGLWIALVFGRLGSDAFIFVLAALGLMPCAGAWFMTRAEPDGPYFDDRKVLRRVIRTLTLAGATILGISLANELLYYLWRDWSGPRQLLAMLGGIGMFLLLAAMELVPWYLASLSKRMNGRWLKISGLLAGVSLPVCYALLLVIALSVSRLGVSLLEWAAITLIVGMFASPGAYALAWAMILRRRMRAAERELPTGPAAHAP